MTEWIFSANVIATDMGVGNSFAMAIGADAGDGLTFTNGKALRLIGSQDSTPVAWFAHVPLKKYGFDQISEFITNGPYPLLNAIGLSDQVIAGGKSFITVEVGDRLSIRDSWQGFISSRGYEVIP